ncbi:hypothetical protein KKF55_05620 [Patescibacteria group bacterium]|nr:hypothetical protein [Patescibacteria group bacterium]
MLYNHKHQHWHNSEHLREHREIFNKLDEPYQRLMQPDPYFSLWNKDELQPLHEYAASIQNEEFTIDNLKKYIYRKKPADLNTVDRSIIKLMQDLKDSDLATRQKADEHIINLVTYIKERQAVHGSTKEKLGEAKKEWKGLPPAVESVWEGSKKTLGAYAERFNNSKGKDKVVMIAGVAASLLILRQIYKSAQKHKNRGGFLGFIAKTTHLGGKTLILTGGAFLGYSALQAVNRTIERTRGRPLVNIGAYGMGIEGGGIFPAIKGDQETWNAAKHKKELNDAWAQLKGESLPVEEFLDFTSNDDEKKKYACGLVNLMFLDTKDLVKLYRQSARTKTINHDKASKSPFDASKYSPEKSPDGLTPTQRYNLVQKILDAFGYLDPADLSKVDKDKITDDQMNMSISQLALERL